MSQTMPAAEENGNRYGVAGVLVVDDEPSVRRLIQRILEREGFHVMVANGGQQAMELFRRHRDEVDVLLTDVMMPGMSGPELVQRLTQEDPELPVLMMSGYTADAVESGDSSPSLVELLRKPFSPADLVTAIRATLEKRSRGSSGVQPRP